MSSVLGLRSKMDPCDDELLGLLRAAASNAARAAELLDLLMTNWPDRGDLAEDILGCEHDGDRITHDVIQLLNTAKPQRLDRGDVLSLASALDDIVDYAEETADLLGLYKVEAPMESAERLTGVLREAALHVAATLAALGDRQPLGEHVREVNRLENEGDRVSRAALASLFAWGIDPMVVIRWKDIVERTEEAIDACEHAANIAEGIDLKTR